MIYNNRKRICRLLLFVVALFTVALIICLFTADTMSEVPETTEPESDPQITFLEPSEEPEELKEPKESVETQVGSIEKLNKKHRKDTPKIVCEAIEGPTTNETQPEVSEYDAELLAMVIYQETGSDSICDDCRRRVADVVLNRVSDDRFPDTIYDVLTQESQYGAYYWTGVVWPERANYSCEEHAVERARRIAFEVLSGQHSELYGNGYVWQAAFVQGSEGFWCCGTYFGQ